MIERKRNNNGVMEVMILIVIIIMRRAVKMTNGTVLRNVLKYEPRKLQENSKRKDKRKKLQKLIQDTERR